MSDEIQTRFGRLAGTSQSFSDRVALADRDLERATMREAEVTARTRGWVMAANAGAMLICFNTALDGRVCDWTIFQPLVFLFALGLFAAFLAVFADRRQQALTVSNVDTARSISRAMVEMVATSERAKLAVEKGNIASATSWVERAEGEMDSLNMRAGVAETNRTAFWHTTSGVLELVGTICFASAIWWVVTDARFVGALCPASQSG